MSQNLSLSSYFFKVLNALCHLHASLHSSVQDRDKNITNQIRALKTNVQKISSKNTNFKAKWMNGPFLWALFSEFLFAQPCAVLRKFEHSHFYGWQPGLRFPPFFQPCLSSKSACMSNCPSSNCVYFLFINKTFVLSRWLSIGKVRGKKLGRIVFVCNEHHCSWCRR